MQASYQGALLLVSNLGLARQMGTNFPPSVDYINLAPYTDSSWMWESRFSAACRAHGNVDLVLDDDEVAIPEFKAQQAALITTLEQVLCCKSVVPSYCNVRITPADHYTYT